MDQVSMIGSIIQHIYQNEYGPRGMTDMIINRYEDNSLMFQWDEQSIFCTIWNDGSVDIDDINDGKYRSTTFESSRFNEIVEYLDNLFER